jgi:hypothetical protein
VKKSAAERIGTPLFYIGAQSQQVLIAREDACDPAGIGVGQDMVIGWIFPDDGWRCGQRDDFGELLEGGIEFGVGEAMHAALVAGAQDPGVLLQDEPGGDDLQFASFPEIDDPCDPTSLGEVAAGGDVGVEDNAHRYGRWERRVACLASSVNRMASYSLRFV